jgi:branched-chain amino acid transport system substrate-binding protein
VSDKPQAKIGFAAPLTGDQAIAGIPMCQCAELAVNQANERGDVPFDLILQPEDDRADPATAAVVARRFAADPIVVGVVGHKNSGPSAVAGPIYNASSVVQVTPSCTNAELSQPGYRTFFRLCAHDALQGAVAARYGVRVLGATRIAILHDQTDYGQPLAEVVRETTGQEGAKVVLFQGAAVGQKDFAEAVSLIRQVSPDLIYLGLTEIEGSILARQLRGAGIKAILFGAQGGRESKFAQLAGAAAEGSFHTYAGVDPESTQSARAFMQQFTAQHGPVPGYGPEVYDATRIVITALTRAGKLDRIRVVEEVAGIRDFDGVTGRINFDSRGDRLDPQVTIWRDEGGQMRLLGLAHHVIPEP